MTQYKMLNSPINRLGGKYRLRKQLIPHIPDHTCYVEAFFGAGWLYFGKVPSKVEVINDIDGELINMFKMIRCHPEEMKRILDKNLVGRSVFEEFKSQDTLYLTEIQRAVRYLYIINTSFASKATTFGYSPLKRPNTKYKSFELIDAVTARLKNTYVENLDYKTLIKKYDRPGTFFFFDPPYFETCIKFTGDINIDFGKEEHIALRDACKTLQGKFLLTINDHPWIRSLYQDFYIESTKVNYSCTNGKNQDCGELIISNYKIGKKAPN